MEKTMADLYVCPIHHTPLQLAVNSLSSGGDVHVGRLTSAEKLSYEIENGIPDFLPKGFLSPDEERTLKEYDESAGEAYNAAMDWLFQSYYEDEDAVRAKMIALLELNPGSKVLEVGCGTGRDSFRIARELGPGGSLFLQDLSGNMVLKAREKLTGEYQKLGLSCGINFFRSTATYLPFRDGVFDAVFHFGGFNTFSQKSRTLLEFSRVVKKGGKVVFGDESLPPWMEGTEFGGIITTNNPLFKNKVPIETLPENSRDVVLRWILGNCFYLIDYRVGDGPPPLNLDLPHKGRRGGTLRTRYYGQLEGVTLETKDMVRQAAQKAGLSIHEWLDRFIKEAARKELEK